MIGVMAIVAVALIFALFLRGGGDTKKEHTGGVFPQPKATSGQPARDAEVAPEEGLARMEPGLTPSDPGASNSMPAMTIGSLPPSFQPQQRLKEAAFAAEAVDPDFRNRSIRLISASLAAIKPGVADAQIECKSSICRVELTSNDVATSQEHRRRFAIWFDELSRLGFSSMGSEVSPNGHTTLSYLFTKSMPLNAQLPAELPPEMAESFKQALRVIDKPQGHK
jgi:hypothetical protein